MYKLAGVVAFITLALDQASKIWVQRDFLSVCKPVVDAFVESRQLLYCGESISLLPILNFRLHLNPGISFSWFSDTGEVGRWVLSLVAVAMVLFLVWYIAKERRFWVTIGGGMIIGGAIGNLIDRVYIGAVVDFIDFHIGAWHPFVFNIADAGISIGIVCLLIDTFFYQPKQA